MRKFIFLFFMALICFPLLTYSQSKIGAYAGINLGKLSGDTPQDATFKNLSGLNAGAHLDIKLTTATSLNMGIRYLQLGTKVFYKVPKVEDLVDSLQLRLNYFTIPLSFKVNSTNERFYASAGIEAGYLLNSKLLSNDIDQEIDFDISEFNVSVHFGVGMKIPLGYPVLFIEANYSQGLINITDVPTAQTAIPRVKTNGFNVLAGIEIPLSKNKPKD